MDPPSESRIDALNTVISNLADKATLADGPPNESRIDALKAVTPNLADKPTLANGPAWQTNLLWLMDPLGKRAEMP